MKANPFYITLGSFLAVLLTIQALINRRVFVIFDGEKPFDVATLALSAATVVLTGVGVIVAIAAVWGYNEIRNKSLEAAEKAATTVAAKIAKDTAEVVAARTVADWLKSRETNEEKEQTNEFVDEAVGNPKSK